MGRSYKGSKLELRDVVQWRLSVLKLAEELGNVTETCRRHGLSRSSFYEWKRRLKTQGLDGLKDLPSAHKSHPQTTPPKTLERIKELALKHPAHGCNWLEAMLAREGREVSSITIQKTLNGEGLGTKRSRWLALEKAHANNVIALSKDQVAFLEKMNPCFRDRHLESLAPGERLSAETFFVASPMGIGRVYVHSVVDAYSSYAFSLLHVSRIPEITKALLNKNVLPFLNKLGFYNNQKFSDMKRRPYELSRDLLGVEKPFGTASYPEHYGFFERFKSTVLSEFFVKNVREGSYDSTKALQAEFDTWLINYNNKRPHLGYRNMGKPPIEAIKAFVNQEKQARK